MKKSYILGSVLLGAVAFALVANAGEMTPTPAPTRDPSVRQEIREEVKEEVQELREDFKAKREELEQRKQEFEEKIKTVRDALVDRIKAKRDDLKVRLGNIKDEAKRRIVERIDQSMDALNDRMVNHFTQVLDKIEAVLKRIGARADQAAERGLDVSAVRVALDEAVKAIASAREAIRVQAGKTYVINVTDDASLRNRVGEARQSLRKDLQVVQDAVKAAHEAARKAAVTLAQLLKPSPSPSVSVAPTSSPSPTPIQIQ